MHLKVGSDSKIIKADVHEVIPYMLYLRSASFHNILETNTKVRAGKGRKAELPDSGASNLPPGHGKDVEH
jgi:hypothetical protein